jgi:pimeloyl-ACP methyl ester carboxylesterase
VAALASDIAATLELLGIEQAPVIGWSGGGRVAAALAAHRGGVVARPLWLSDFAWRRDLDPADVLVGIGVAAAAGVALAAGSGGDGGTGGATAPTGPGPVGTPTPQPTPTPAPDVTGRWLGQFVENPSTTQCSTTSDLALNLQQASSAVSGTFQLAIRSATAAPADPCPVDPGDAFTGPLSGVVNGDSISLQLQITGGPTFFLNGTISGSRIAGTSPPDAEGPGGSWDVTRQ